MAEERPLVEAEAVSPAGCDQVRVDAFAGRKLIQIAGRKLIHPAV